MVIKKVNLDIVIGVTSAIPDTEFPHQIQVCKEQKL